MRRRLCEALYGAGRIKEAGESLLNIVHNVDESIFTWVSGKLCYTFPPPWIRPFATVFMPQCLSTPEDGDDTTIHSPSPTLLLREWVKLRLTGGSWKDALVDALNVSISFPAGALRGLDAPWVWSLQRRDSRFTGLSVTISKRPIT